MTNVSPKFILMEEGGDLFLVELAGKRRGSF